MNGRACIRLLVTIGAWFAAQVAVAGDTPPANVILIVSDDAGHADFSMHGSPNFPTPNIDRIAAEGVRFSQGYVTASVCSPSRAGLITGRYQQRFGHHHNIPPRYSEDNGLPVEEVTFADLVRDRGYRTIALGKWHLGYAPKFHPLSRGFDDYYGFLQGARKYVPIKGNRLNRLLRDREPVKEDFEYMTEELAEEAGRYIDEHAARPFFMYLCFNAVHGPLQATDADLARVDPALAGNRRKLAAMTMSLDDAVGTVLDALERNGIVDNTLVVFVNDNGGASHGANNAPLRGRKGQPYEGGIRVPFVARWPAAWPKGLVYDKPVSTLDLLPTVLAFAGPGESIETPELDGIDLTPMLSRSDGTGPNRTLFWSRKSTSAVRDGDLKLVVTTGDQPGVELFDLRLDPNEQQNIAAAHPADVVRMRAMHVKWNGRNEAPRWGRGG